MLLLKHGHAFKPAFIDVFFFWPLMCQQGTPNSKPLNPLPYHNLTYTKVNMKSEDMRFINREHFSRCSRSDVCYG